MEARLNTVEDENTALKSQVVTLQSQVELLINQQNYVISFWSGNLLLPFVNGVSPNDVVVGGDSTWPFEGVGGNDGSNCPASVSNADSQVMFEDNTCTVFGYNSGEYNSRLVLIVKFPHLWKIGRIWLLRGIWSPNYAPNNVEIYTYKGDSSAYTRNADGFFDGSAIAWESAGSFGNSRSGGTGMEGTDCSGGHLDSEERWSAARTVDNLDIEGTMIKLDFTSGCAGTQLALSQLKMCRTAGDSECGPSTS